MDRTDAEIDWTQIPDDESSLEPDWTELESDTIVNTADMPQDSAMQITTTIPGMMSQGERVSASSIEESLRQNTAYAPTEQY